MTVTRGDKKDCKCLRSKGNEQRHRPEEKALAQEGKLVEGKRLQVDEWQKPSHKKDRQEKERRPAESNEQIKHTLAQYSERHYKRRKPIAQKGEVHRKKL